MKTLIIATVIAGIMFIGVNAFYSNDLIVESVEVELEDWQTDEEAVQAAKDVIDRKNDEEDLKSVRGQIETLKAREDELEKRLNLY